MEKHKIWGTTESKGYTATKAVSKLSILLLVVTSVAIGWSYFHPFEGGHGVTIALTFLWAIGAPVWFWYEYFFLYLEEKALSDSSFEFFKQGLQLSIAIWAGLVISLCALAHSDVFKQSEKSCPHTTSSVQPDRS